jgi:hypothetical protein
MSGEDSTVVRPTFGAERSWLCTLSLYRRADGTVAARLERMSPSLIDTTGTDVPSRVRIIAEWVAAGAADLAAQAVELEVSDA